jgi:hypothetical protein
LCGTTIDPAEMTQRLTNTHPRHVGYAPDSDRNSDMPDGR